MTRYLPTGQLADALGRSDSTYDLNQVETALGTEAVDDAPITGLVSESFDPLGVHDL